MSNTISIFDIFKIGVGPSSSHTLGPWLSAQYFISEIENKYALNHIKGVKVELYGSLSFTGRGHATDVALILGLCGETPTSIDTDEIPNIISKIKKTGSLNLKGNTLIPFSMEKNIIFMKETLPFHPNGIRFFAETFSKMSVEETYYSIGGGFVTKEKTPLYEKQRLSQSFPYPISNGLSLLAICLEKEKSISEIVLENELSIRKETDVDRLLLDLWQTMLKSLYTGCHTEGSLPGGLQVFRRASSMHQKLMDVKAYSTPDEWLKHIRSKHIKFREILKWVNCFALSVNEVNASLGRVVTAPTNGSAGVVPAVLMYYLCIENHQAGFEQIKQFLLVAGEIGSIFKKGATLSAAMGGCQAEIGVSSAMAAAALTEQLGGSVEQSLMAAEVAMEHHLGLTCDPVGGLVQIPCIERNAMGAIKAIQAAELALDSNPKHAKVSLDDVVRTMWNTAKDMNSKYKETSQGGLAVEVSLKNC